MIVEAVSIPGWTVGAFFALLGGHVVFSLISNRYVEGEQPTGGIRRVHVFIQAPIFWLAVYFALCLDVFSRQLVSPLYIGLGLLAGHMVFGLSLLITHNSIKDAWSHFFDFGDLWNFTVDSPIVLLRFLGVAVAEELIWRVSAQKFSVVFLEQFMSANAAAFTGIVVVAALFVVVHKHFFENSFMVSLEFVGFSLLLGVLYHVTNSFVLVMVIHAMRDIEIAYLEYLMKVDELGDPELAAREMDKVYMPSRQQAK
ncbi:MAG: hypothetical protein AMXMBFR84_38300 [Candidatus Hydrogenedentota bacterium]